MGMLMGIFLCLLNTCMLSAMDMIVVGYYHFMFLLFFTWPSSYVHVTFNDLN